MHDASRIQRGNASGDTYMINESGVQNSIQAGACHANETTRTASDKAASRLMPLMTVLQMYHMDTARATPGADSASMPNAISTPIFCMALEAAPRATDRKLVVSGDDGCLLTTGATGAEVDCEVVK